jgi:biopolymer transport protein TolQ
MSQFNLNIIQLIAQAGFSAKFILLILLFFSVLSWAIVIEKFWLIKKIKKEIKIFLQVFKFKDKPEDVYNLNQSYKNNPAYIIFGKVYNRMSNISGNSEKWEVKRDLLQLEIEKATNEELNRIENRIGLLASISSSSPFLGLLGTVWGIMNSFLSIGAKGNATLTTIAPGIAEALVTTVGGLLVAIPALLFYNYLIGKFKELSNEFENYSVELINLYKS